MSLFGTSWDDPKTAAIMGLAGGLLQGNAGAGLQQGLLGAQRQSQINAQTKRMEAQDAMDAEKFGIQKQQWQSQLDAAKAKQFNEQQVREILPRVVSGEVDAATAIAAGVPAELIKAIKEAPNLGRSKVARTVKGMGPDGREYEYQVDEYGQRVGDGLAQFRAPVMQDLGGQVAALDPYTLQPKAQFGKTMTFADRNAAGNLALSRERLNMDKNQGQYQFNAELGGYVPKAPGGQFVPLQGSPNAGAPKLTEGEAKAGLYLGQMRSATDTLQQLDKRGVTARPESVALAGSTLGNYLAPKDAQQIAQVRNQWSEAYLRAKTGAAATQGEVDLNNRTFFPQPGDSQAVIEQKAQARRQAELDMQLPAGRAAQRTQIAAPPQPKPGQMGSGSFRILSVE